MPPIAGNALNAAFDVRVQRICPKDADGAKLALLNQFT